MRGIPGLNTPVFTSQWNVNDKMRPHLQNHDNNDNNDNKNKYNNNNDKNYNRNIIKAILNHIKTTWNQFEITWKPDRFIWKQYQTYKKPKKGISKPYRIRWKTYKTLIIRKNKIRPNVNNQKQARHLPKFGGSWNFRPNVKNQEKHWKSMWIV